MVEFGNTPNWVDSRETKKLLASEGWFCIDSYAKDYAPPIDGPAVYLFLLYDMEDYSKAIFAYVGMSVALKRRMSCHEVLAELRRGEHWPCRWFKPTPVDDLRSMERACIERFDPAWNIVGKKRGVRLS